MLRVWVVAAIGLAISGAAWAIIEPSRHVGFGLEITFPEKWIVGSGEEPLLLLSRSMDPISVANCVATGERVQGTRALTQAQINKSLTAPFGEDFWRNVYATSNLMAGIKRQGARAHESGVTIQEAFFELSKNGAAAETRIAIHQAIFVRPGLTVSVACSARAAAYPMQKAVLAGVIDSVRFIAPAAPVASVDQATKVSVKDGGSTNLDSKIRPADVSRAGLTLIELSK